jgi:hypothetical protein
MKRLKSPCLCLALGLIAFSLKSSVKTDDFTGYAYKDGTRQLLYKEESAETLVDQRPVEDVTKYYDPSGALIASRTLKFSASGYTPDFKTEDFRTGYMEGAEVKDNSVRLFVRESKTSPLKEKTFPLAERSVIDGGFNQFIKDKWNNLEQGQQLDFNFMVPSRLDYYSFRAIRVSETPSELIVRIEPGSMMIRWLAGAIVVHYDKSTRRILSYEGKSNITDSKGTNLVVRLVYPQEGP